MCSSLQVSEPGSEPESPNPASTGIIDMKKTIALLLLAVCGLVACEQSQQAPAARWTDPAAAPG